MQVHARSLLFFLFSPMLPGALPSWEEQGAWFDAVQSGALERVDPCLEAYQAAHPGPLLYALINSLEPPERKSAFFIACQKADAHLARKLLACGADPMIPGQCGYLPPYGRPGTLPQEVGEEISTQA